MAYCPQCGREQKCGCDVCHHCGVPLVDEGHANAEARPPVRSVADEISSRALRETEPLEKTSVGPEEEPEREATPGATRVVLPALLAILGCGILLIALIEIIHTASDFVGPGAGTAPAVKHLGYYLGHLLYNSSVRLLIGFALTAAGLFYAPPLPFSKRDNWRHAAMALGTTMGVVAVFFLLAAVLIIIPGSLSLLVRNLLPSPATSISVFIVMGIALLAGTYLITTRLQASGGRFTFMKVSRKQR
jgi:hypothetical protein